VVLAPDLHGFGESPFAGVPTLEQAGAIGLARAVDEWRRLLGLVDIPTALVGYSMSGLALLAIDDNDAGQHVSRIALNPILAGHDPIMRKKFRRMALMANTIGRIGPLRRLGIRLRTSRDPDVLGMSEETLGAVIAELNRMPGQVMGRIVRALSETPPHVGRHRRAAVIVSLDDPWMNFATLDRVIADVGNEPAQIHRQSTGGHHPHVESRQYPERSARNLVDIVRVIDSMLVTASQPSVGSPSLAGPTETAGAPTEGF
jgi:pimeloyl-ACP methyl ester carboxylesterase